jgi:hypothetical protein
MQIHVDRILRRVVEDQRRVGAPVFARRRKAVWKKLSAERSGAGVGVRQRLFY